MTKNGIGYWPVGQHWKYLLRDPDVPRREKWTNSDEYFAISITCQETPNRNASPFDEVASRTN